MYPIRSHLETPRPGPNSGGEPLPVGNPPLRLIGDPPFAPSGAYFWLSLPYPSPSPDSSSGDSPSSPVSPRLSLSSHTSLSNRSRPSRSYLHRGPHPVTLTPTEPFPLHVSHPPSSSPSEPLYHLSGKVPSTVPLYQPTVDRPFRLRLLPKPKPQPRTSSRSQFRDTYSLPVLRLDPDSSPT